MQQFSQVIQFQSSVSRRVSVTLTIHTGVHLNFRVTEADATGDHQVQVKLQLSTQQLLQQAT